MGSLLGPQKNHTTSEGWLGSYALEGETDCEIQRFDDYQARLLNQG